MSAVWFTVLALFSILGRYKFDTICEPLAMVIQLVLIDVALIATW